jgi:hypothetical protein
MNDVPPDQTAPLRSAAPSMRTIMIRFIGLQIVAVAVLVLLWSR